MVHRATPRRILEDRLIRALMHRCDRLIAISEWIAAAWREDSPRLDPVVVYNGIPLPEMSLRRSDDGPFTLGMASRLSEKKGVEEFLELAAAILARDPNIRFRVAGDGPQRADYEYLANRLGHGDAIVFEGFVSDMAKFWSKVDLVAFTPPFEPFGLRVVEPVVHGVPVVAYLTHSGSDEVIERCRGVAAVDYGDLDGLVEQVMHLRDKPQVRAQMTKEGRDDVANCFSLATMFLGVAAVYCDALDAAGLEVKS
jgi:glycosyltransferase involved in cell wall biosynthesis